MKTSSSKARLRSLAFSIGLLQFLVTAMAVAGNISVYPLRATLEGAKNSDVLTVTNVDTKPLLLQPTVFAWSQVDGKEILEATRDILVAPPLVEIAPGESQAIRLVSRIEADKQKELTYRVILQEIPKVNQSGQTAVSMALRVSLPIFILPKIPAQAKIDAQLQLSNTNLFVAIKNSGNAHLQFKTAILRDAIGVVGSSSTMTYVLHGQAAQIKFALPIRPVVGNLRIEAQTDAGDFSQDVRPQ